MTFIDAGEKLSPFLEKLPLWIRRVENNNFANFPRLEESLQPSPDAAGTIPASLKCDILAHLGTLVASFHDYFPTKELQPHDAWVRNPFLVNLESVDDQDLAKDDLIDLRHKELLKREFQVKSLGDFWYSMMIPYPVLAKRAMTSIIPFVTTYLCEAGFSILLTIKTKSRNKLDAKDDMRLALSKSKPRFHLLVNKKQEQHSH